jgi:hypothetical protein
VPPITVRPRGPGQAKITIDTGVPLSLEGFNFVLAKRKGDLSLGADGKWQRTAQPLQPEDVENRDGTTIVYVGPGIVNHIDEGENLTLTIYTAASGDTPALSRELRWPRLGKSSGSLGASPFDAPSRPAAPPSPPPRPQTPPPEPPPPPPPEEPVVVPVDDRTQTIEESTESDVPQTEPEVGESEPVQPPPPLPPPVQTDKPPWRAVAIIGGLCVLLFAGAAFWLYVWPELRQRFEATAPGGPSTNGSEFERISTELKRLIEADGDVGRILDGGKRLLEAPNPEQRDLGLRAIDRAATRGSVPAMLEMGRMFDPNVPQPQRRIAESANPVVAGFWYRKAAEAGSPDAGGALREMCTKIAEPAQGLNEQQRTEAVAQYCN